VVIEIKKEINILFDVKNIDQHSLMKSEPEILFGSKQQEPSSKFNEFSKQSKINIRSLSKNRL